LENIVFALQKLMALPKNHLFYRQEVAKLSMQFPIADDVSSCTVAALLAVNKIENQSRCGNTEPSKLLLW
jgi:hypothetical protein